MRNNIKSLKMNLLLIIINIQMITTAIDRMHVHSIVHLSLFTQIYLLVL